MIRARTVTCRMKNLFDVLRQKETELQQIQKEVEALRVAARLLADEEDADVESPAIRTSVAAAVLSRQSVSGPATTVVAAPPTLRPATPLVNGEGYSAARDNALRQFP